MNKVNTQHQTPARVLLLPDLKILHGVVKVKYLVRDTCNGQRNTPRITLSRSQVTGGDEGRGRGAEKSPKISFGRRERRQGGAAVSAEASKQATSKEGAQQQQNRVKTRGRPQREEEERLSERVFPFSSQQASFILVPWLLKCQSERGTFLRAEGKTDGLAGRKGRLKPLAFSPVHPVPSLLYLVCIFSLSFSVRRTVARSWAGRPDDNGGS